MTRRDALKRGAIVGGGALWVTPVVQVIGLGQSHAQAASGGGVSPTTTTPPAPTTTTTTAPPPKLKAISFVAFRFTCGTKTYFAKVENITTSGFECEGPNNGANCGVPKAGALDGCGLFTLGNYQFNADGEIVGVRVQLTCTGGIILAGSSRSGPACIAASVSGGSATFLGAPK